MTERDHLKDIWEQGYYDFIELDPIEAGCEDLECVRLIRDIV
jgi:DNA-binding Xre family transcriptional regulator